MSRWDRALVWLAVVAVVGSGVGYGVMRYALEPSDEWAVVNHPWQPHLQHLHVVAAPLLVLAGGVLWREHARRHLAEGRRRGRPSGLAMALTFLPMVFSGVLIQVAVGDGWRTLWVVVHVATSLLWLAGFALHPVLRRRDEDTNAKTQRRKAAEGCFESRSSRSVAGDSLTKVASMARGEHRKR